MKLYDNYIINPSEELMPSYRISPFRTSDMAVSALLNASHAEIAYNYFDERFPNYTLTANGRGAITIALAYYNLKQSDTVTILTTSGNFYISGCVTKAIETVCKWSREIEPSTKIIFVNHEFGYPYKGLSELKKYGLPIIEDCAHTFYSNDMSGEMGTVGDFIIYSLPKALPMQTGGILVNNLNLSIQSPITKKMQCYILRIVGSQVAQLKHNAEQRVENYNYLCAKFANINITPHFERKNGVVPGVFMFNTPVGVDLAAMKEYVQCNGIESSVFYGREAFFIPCHQNLSRTEMDYLYYVIKYFKKQ